jgi:hypothetical protein
MLGQLRVAFWTLHQCLQFEYDSGHLIDIRREVSTFLGKMSTRLEWKLAERIIFD